MRIAHVVHVAGTCMGCTKVSLWDTYLTGSLFRADLGVTVVVMVLGFALVLCQGLACTGTWFVW